MTVYKVTSGVSEFSVAITLGELLLITDNSHAYYRGTIEPISPRNGDRWDVVNSDNFLVDIREYRVNTWVSIIPLLSGVSSVMYDRVSALLTLTESLNNEQITDCLNYAVSVNNESIVIAESAKRYNLIIQNVGHNNIYLSFGNNQANVNSGLLLKPDGIYETGLNCQVNAVSDLFSELRISSILRG